MRLGPTTLTLNTLRAGQVLVLKGGDRPVIQNIALYTYPNWGYSQILLLFSVHTDAEKSNMLNQSFYLEYDIIFLINWLIDSSK